jgi:heme a synthase
MLIGVWSIALVGFVMRFESRRWVKLAAVGVLLGVVAQGVLGGFRVWLDERGLAMLHGAFAACVFSLMAVVATSLSRTWLQAPQKFAGTAPAGVKMMAMATLALLAVQYLLGGLIRHKGTGLHEHLGIGILALLAVIINAAVAQRSGVRWLKASGWTLLAIVLLQVALGGAAWVTKFGFGATGYVAVADSIQQIAFRTAHTVVGIVVFMAAVVHVARMFRIASAGRHRSAAGASTPSELLAATGGAL